MKDKLNLLELKHKRRLLILGTIALLCVIFSFVVLYVEIAPRLIETEKLFILFLVIMSGSSSIGMVLILINNVVDEMIKIKEYCIKEGEVSD